MMNITPLWMAIIASGVGLYAVAKKYPQYFRKIAPAKLPAPQGSKLLLTPQPSTQQQTEGPFEYLFRGFMWNIPSHGKKFEPLIYAAEDKHGIPRNLLASLIQQESNFDPNARGPMTKYGVRALGLMQLMPNFHPGVNALNPAAAVDYGAAYLRRLYNRFHSWKLALAAYNAGPENVAKYNGIPPFAETQNYVANITGRVPV